MMARKPDHPVVEVEREVSWPDDAPLGMQPYLGPWVIKIDGRVVDREAAEETWKLVTDRPFPLDPETP